MSTPEEMVERKRLVTDRLRTPSGGVRRGVGGSGADMGEDDDELLLYLYEKSSDSRARYSFDCVSMGGLRVWSFRIYGVWSNIYVGGL